MSNTQMVHVKISREMYRALNRIKKQQTKTMSAVIREALSAHIEQEIGEIIDPNIEWGGYRETDGDAEKEWLPVPAR